MFSKIHFAFIKCGGWVVALVFCLHRLVMNAGVREQSDALMHFSGGLAIAYVCFRCIAQAKSWFAPLPHAARTLVAFSGGCTAAVLWELGEFASDSILRTHVQKSLPETMLDLMYGSLGAATAVGLLFVLGRKKTVRR
jgi:hypothetical protein